MSLIEEFEQKLNNGKIKTDSDIEAFIEEKQKECTHEFGTCLANEIWATYYQWRAKGTNCEGCRHAGCWGIYPCNECSRKIQLFDHFDMTDKKLDEMLDAFRHMSA